MGLRARLMLFVTAVLLGPFALIGADTYEHYVRTTGETLRGAGALATGMAGRDFGIGTPIRQLLLSLARNGDVVYHDGESCSRTSRALRQDEPRYVVVGAARPDGTLFCVSADSPLLGPGTNVANFEWFRQALAGHDFSQGHYDPGGVSGRRALIFAYPAVEAGEVKAVVFAGLDLVWISRAIRGLAEREYVLTYLLDWNGQVLAQSRDEEISIGRRIEDTRFVGAMAQGALGSFVARDLDGVERIYFARPLQSIGADTLYFVAGVDSAKLAAVSFAHFAEQMAVIALIATLAYLVAWWGGALAFVEPVHRLVATIERFRGGDASARVGPAHARNEIGLLGRAFDQMADAIGKHQSDLETAAVKLKSVIDNVGEGIVTADEQGTILSFNPAAERITGYAAQEAIGRNVAMLAAEPHRSRHSGYIADYLASEKGKIIGGPIRYRQLEAQRKDGTVVPIELGLAESWIGGERVFIGVLHDISARIKAEAGAKRRAREIGALFETSPAAIIALDREAKVVWWNPAAERIYGYPATEVIGQITPVVPESEFMAFWNQFARVLRGEALRNVRGVRQTKSGRRIEIEFSAAPLADDSGWAIGVVFVTNDVTEHVQIQRQFLQAQKMEAVGQLTGGIAHDFNNLLGVLVGNLDLARDRLAADPETLGLVDSALDAGLRGAELNKRLLAFARQQALSPEVVDVNATVAGMVGLLKRSLGERIEIQLDRADDVWPVRVDPTQLETAIVNLAVNARDAMPNGGTLTIETRSVTLDAEYVATHEYAIPGDYAMVAVSDTGTGMAPEVLGRVFEPFFTTKEVGKGTGLGLSMVYGFIKQSGGHVNIYSEPGKGTTIRLYLPRVMEGEALAKAPPPAVGGERASGELVLVVEDNPDMRKIAVRQIKDLGYQVAEAENVDRARALLDEGLKPDLLFTDVVMPGATDGIEFAEEVAGRFPGARILLTSGFTERVTIEARKREGRPLPFALLGKPYRKDELARAVRSALDNGA